MVLCVNVLVLDSIEKLLSDSAASSIGVVIMVFYSDSSSAMSFFWTTQDWRSVFSPFQTEWCWNPLGCVVPNV